MPPENQQGPGNNGGRLPSTTRASSFGNGPPGLRNPSMDKTSYLLM